MPQGTQVQQSLIPQRAQPTRYGDNSTPAGPPRASAYNEQVVQSMVPTKHVLSEEGAYFTVINPTPGTGVAHALTTAFSSTAALFSLFNSAPVGGANIYLDYLRLIETATAPATSLQQDFLIQLDQALNRAPTANNVALTPVNLNLGSANKGFANWQAFNAGAMTVPAQATATTKNASRIHLATGQVILGDENVIQFGGVDTLPGQGGGAAVRAVDLGRRVTHAPPIMCAPQTWLTIFRWGIGEATNVPSYEYEIGYWER